MTERGVSPGRRGWRGWLAWLRLTRFRLARLCWRSFARLLPKGGVLCGPIGLPRWPRACLLERRLLTACWRLRFFIGKRGRLQAEIVDTELGFIQVDRPRLGLGHSAFRRTAGRLEMDHGSFSNLPAQRGRRCPRWSVVRFEHDGGLCGAGCCTTQRRGLCAQWSLARSCDPLCPCGIGRHASYVEFNGGLLPWSTKGGCWCTQSRSRFGSVELDGGRYGLGACCARHRVDRGVIVELEGRSIGNKGDGGDLLRRQARWQGGYFRDGAGWRQSTRSS